MKVRGKSCMWPFSTNNHGLNCVEKPFLPKYARGVGKEAILVKTKTLPDCSKLKVEFQCWDWSLPFSQ